ncbi:SDR family oxidoreductase [Nitratireductor aquimarinus]|uniref:SDR family NAD(P)-dependent oxidoreductase n=1 Tax=Nitratireductor aquimarinus TaxID=889300 RepID=UPI002935A50D|nr:SDR family oxidoreductase [Nitratireductor aquimarinus]MDV2967094.1 SDR family oxidoreductase [Nitratireductor aquimarinus]
MSTAAEWRAQMTDLSGKAAIVTGGARGQGEAEARLLAECGAQVMICDVLVDEGTALAAELGERACFRQLDVTDAEAWGNTVAAMRDWAGRLDILVNNAGIINRTLIASTEPEAWRRLLDVNLTGAFLGIRAAAPLMVEGGGGSIINISSNSAFSGHADPAYTASKWGLRGLTRSAANEFSADGIRVNAVCPGLIVTGLNRESPHLRPMIDLTPVGRSGEAEEVAQLVLYLASDASRFVTGEDFLIDGGFVAGAAYRRVGVDTGILRG